MYVCVRPVGAELFATGVNLGFDIKIHFNYFLLATLLAEMKDFMLIEDDLMGAFSFVSPGYTVLKSFLFILLQWSLYVLSVSFSFSCTTLRLAYLPS